MASAVQQNFRIRKNFAGIQPVIEMPNLIEIQKQSYAQFFQIETEPDKRKDIGLQAVFQSVFPIKDFNKTASLESVTYHLEKPEYDVDEFHQVSMTFAAPLKVATRLAVRAR